MKSTTQTAILVIGILFAVIMFALMLMFISIPQNNHDILLEIVSVITSGLMTIIGYYFGSSAGSAKKTEALLATPTEKVNVPDQNQSQEKT